MTASINTAPKENKSMLQKAWDAAAKTWNITKKVSIGGLALASAIQVGQAVWFADGVSNILYYGFQDTKADFGYYITGGPFTKGPFNRGLSAPKHIVICQPKHFNQSTHTEIAPPDHLANLYSRMEENLRYQLKTKTGHVHSDLQIAINHYSHPVVIFNKVNETKYQYDYKIVNRSRADIQNCSQLTPDQSWLTVKERTRISVEDAGLNQALINFKP